MKRTAEMIKQHLEGKQTIASKELFRKISSSLKEAGFKAPFKISQIIPQDGFQDGGEPYTDEEMDSIDQEFPGYQEHEIIKEADKIMESTMGINNRDEFVRILTQGPETVREPGHTWTFNQVDFTYTEEQANRLWEIYKTYHNDEQKLHEEYVAYLQGEFGQLEPPPHPEGMDPQEGMDHDFE